MLAASTSVRCERSLSAVACTPRYVSRFTGIVASVRKLSDEGVARGVPAAPDSQRANGPTGQSALRLRKDAREFTRERQQVAAGKRMTFAAATWLTTHIHI